MQSHNVVGLKCCITFFKRICQICTLSNKGISFFRYTFLKPSQPQLPLKFSSNKQPMYSSAQCCFVTFSFPVMFNERLDLFPLLNKILLVLSYPKYVESLLSMNHSISFNELDILVAKQYTRIICVKPKVSILQCCLHFVYTK